MHPILIYLLIINALGYLLMLIDKSKAKKGKWRIPEKTLLTVAVVGGSVGSLIGMYTVRHKTRKPAFSIGIPLIMVLQVAVFLILQ